MDNNLSVVISLLSFFLGVIALIKSSSASKLANELTKGQVEMQIRDLISSAKTQYANVAIQLSKDLDNVTLQHATSAALEDVCNAYDEACAKYLDKKVDKLRFKKLYITEIRHWVQDDSTKLKYVMPQSRFQATVKVYDEWNNLE